MAEYSDFKMSPVNESLVAEHHSLDDYVRQDEYKPKFAGFWVRFWAYTIDLIVLYALSGLIIKPIFRFAGLSIANPIFLFFTPFKITILILLLLYFALMTKYFGQTVGKMIMGIKVIPRPGEVLTWDKIIFREIIGRFISKTLLIPYLLVIFMPQKESLHDLFADTHVIYENTYEK